MESVSSGESRFSSTVSARRTERQKKKDMLLNRRAAAGGGGGDVGNATNGDIYDPNRQSKLLRKKRVVTKGKARKKSRSQRSFGASTLTMLIIIGALVTGVLVVSYVFLGKNPAAGQLAGENGSIVSVHNLLRRKFAGGGDGGGGGTQAYNEKPVPHQEASKNNANRIALEEGGGAMRYDLNKIQLDYEKATSHLPEFPKEYLGEIPGEDYDIERDYSPKGGNRFQEYHDGKEPYHITSELIQKSNELARARRSFVKATMKHAWSGYEKYAFGMDEVLPQTRVGGNNWGGMAVTLVDALDTLWLMGMKEEFYKGRNWVHDHLNHNRVGTVSVFETTIRSLGGLLSAYDWSHDQAFLDQAYDLGKRLIKAFDGSSSGIPYGQVNLGSGSASNVGWTGNHAILAEFGTMQIEYRYLAKAMHGEKSTDVFARRTEHVFEIMDDMSPGNGLFPYYVNNNPRGHGHGHKTTTKHHQHRDLNNENGEAKKEEEREKNEQIPQFANNHLTFGAMADSFYEYMLKVWLQGGQTEPMYREMYDKAIQGMHDELLQLSSASGLVYIAAKQGSSIQHRFEHLACFMGGLLALGAYTDPQGLQSERAQRDLTTARALTYTCYQMYARTATGISPESVDFTPNDQNRDYRIGDGRYLLRPEVVESFFVLSFLTNDPVYREWGWEVFQSIEKYCKTSIAYGSLANVDTRPDNYSGKKPSNKMESFFLAETLKYLYLLQDPDTEVDILNKHVFNTEAHPMRIFPAFDAEQQSL